MTHTICCNIITYFNSCFSFLLQRPPSSSLSGYGGLGNDEARSPSSGGGTPGLLQPGSHISGDNISEAGKNEKRILQKISCDPMRIMIFYQNI